MTAEVAMPETVTLLLLDMDGTVYVGGAVIDGVPESLERWTSAGREVVFITNNTSRTIEQHALKLRGMGLPATPNNIVSPVEPTSRFLRDQGVKDVFLVATKAVTEEFASHGIEFRGEPQAVVITYDTELTYAKLAEASSLINTGLPYYATHIDFLCPSENGPVPDVGSFIAMLEKVTGVAPAAVFGKPSDSFVDLIRDRYSHNSIVVGDRLHTDIATGINAHVPTCLVLTGETSQEIADASPYRPTIIAPSLPALIDVLLAH